jgi:hypothetical protein
VDETIHMPLTGRMQDLQAFALPLSARKLLTGNA